MFQIASVLLVLAGILSYLNYRFVRLPSTIGIMMLSLAASLVLIFFGEVGGPIRHGAGIMVSRIDFNETVLHGMLAFLLFAGALQLDLSDLGREWDVITLLSLVGTAVSTLLVGGLAWAVFWWMGLRIAPVYCFLFGALISPTDPISVLGIMKKVGAPRSLETQVTGESLFNDGIGVVIFLSLLAIVHGGTMPSWYELGISFFKDVAGGAATGLVCGVLTYNLLKQVDNYRVEVLLTLGLATGCFSLAEALHVSAPIAVVVAGLFIGNQGRAFAMSRVTEEHLDTFWEMCDEILNALLFLLIGLEVLVVPWSARNFWAGLAAIGMTLLARVLSVGGTVGLMRTWRQVAPGTIRVLTWGGLRGGLSVAMALALPPGEERNLILVVTYVVVVFSVFVQGMTVSRVIHATGQCAVGAEIVGV